MPFQTPCRSGPLACSEMPVQRSSSISDRTDFITSGGIYKKKLLTRVISMFLQLMPGFAIVTSRYFECYGLRSMALHLLLLHPKYSILIRFLKTGGFIKPAGSLRLQNDSGYLLYSAAEVGSPSDSVISPVDESAGHGGAARQTHSSLFSEKTNPVVVVNY